MNASTPDARRYAAIRHRLVLCELLVGCGILVAFQWSGASAALARWSAAQWPQPGLNILGYLAVFGLVYYLVSLPLHVYGSFVLEHAFGLSRLTIPGWLIREGKQLLVSAIIGSLLVEGLYVLLREAPRTWPLWATVGWVGFSVVLARIFPTVLLPLFYKTRPLEDASLRARLLSLCQRVGLPALGVFRFELGAETRKANAALAGLGATRRVLLSDTLVQQFTPEEIEGVLAHELGHQRYRHITKLLVIGAAGSWMAFTLTRFAAVHWVAWLGLSGLSDIGGFPILMLCFSALGLLSLPLQNGLSRAFEWQADRFAIKTTTAPSAFADALRRLAELNLADPNPPRWIVWLLYDHPPITDRIKVAAESSGLRAGGSVEERLGDLGRTQSPEP